MDFVNPTALANRVDQNIIPEFAQGMEWIRARDALAQQHAQSSILARLEELKRRQEVEDFDQAAPSRTAERNYNIGMYGRKGELEAAEQPHKIFTAGVKNSPAGREETVQQLINDPKRKREVEAAERLHGPMVTLDGMLKNGDIAGATRFWEETKAHLEASGYQLPQRFRNAPFEEIRPHIPAFITAGEQTREFRQKQLDQKQKDDAAMARTHVQGGYQLAASRERAAAGGNRTEDRQWDRRAVSDVVHGGSTDPEKMAIARGVLEREEYDKIERYSIQGMTMTDEEKQALARARVARMIPRLYSSPRPPEANPVVPAAPGQSRAPTRGDLGFKVTRVDQSGTN